MHAILNKEGKMLYDFLSDNKGQELYSIIQQYINELKKVITNYIVILAHIGDNDEPKEFYTLNHKAIFIKKIQIQLLKYRIIIC